MANVTVELTQEESNLIRQLLGLSVKDNLAQADKALKFISANGSLDGRFGDEIRRIDLTIIEVLNDAADFYEDLKNKFPAEVDKTGAAV